MDAKGTIRLRPRSPRRPCWLRRTPAGDLDPAYQHLPPTPRLKQTDGLTLLPSGARTESLTHGHTLPRNLFLFTPRSRPSRHRQVEARCLLDAGLELQIILGGD